MIWKYNGPMNNWKCKSPRNKWKYRCPRIKWKYKIPINNWKSKVEHKEKKKSFLRPRVDRGQKVNLKSTLGLKSQQ